MLTSKNKMVDVFHYPPEVFNLLVDSIPLLCKSKQNVILFLRGAGVAQEDLAEVEHIVRTNRKAINKFDIVRNVCQSALKTFQVSASKSFHLV